MRTVLALVKTVTKTKYDVSSLKRVASGAAPLSEDLRKRAKELLGFVVTDGNPSPFNTCLTHCGSGKLTLTCRIKATG